MAGFFVKGRRLYTEVMMILATMQQSWGLFILYVLLTSLGCNDFIVSCSVQGALIHISHLLKMEGTKKLILELRNHFHFVGVLLLSA